MWVKLADRAAIFKWYNQKFALQVHEKKFGTDAVPSGRAVVFTGGELCDYPSGPGWENGQRMLWPFYDRSLTSHYYV